MHFQRYSYLPKNNKRVYLRLLLRKIRITFNEYRRRWTAVLVDEAVPVRAVSMMGAAPAK